MSTFPNVYDPINLKKKLGIVETDQFTFQDISNADAMFQAYQDVIVTGKSIAIHDVNDTSLPLGERHFEPTPMMCLDENKNKQTRNIVVDNMAFFKETSGNYDKANHGLLNSAMGSLQGVSTANFVKNSTSTDLPKCSKVTIITDASGNTDQNYITDEDKATLNPSIFKTKEGMENYTFIEVENGYVTTFYFVSLTVIGLLIFYRLLEGK